VCRQAMLRMQREDALTTDENDKPNEIEDKADQPSHSALARYMLPNGLIAVCANCGKLRRKDDIVLWEQVDRELTSGLQNLTHTLCPECQSLLYPGLPSSKRSFE